MPAKFEITEDIIKKAESYAANGLTYEQVAECLGICYETLRVKSKENSALSAAIKRGKSKGIGMMANNLVKLAKNGNAAANIFWLKVNAKWNETINLNVDEEDSKRKVRDAENKY